MNTDEFEDRLKALRPRLHRYCARIRPMGRPAHFVLIDWSESRIIEIRDFLFAPYVLEAIDWVRLG